MMLAEICGKLLELGSRDPHEFASYYRQNIEAIEVALKSSDALSTELHFGEGAESNSFRFAAIFADFTSVFFRREGTGEILLIGGPDQKVVVSIPRVLEALVGRVPSLEEVRRQMHKLSAGLWFRTDEQAKRLVDELSPLIGSGRVLLRPAKLLFTPIGKTATGGTEWAGLDVDPNSPLSNWEVIDRAPNDVIVPLWDGPIDAEAEKLLFEVTVPYVTGISFKDLAGVLDQEGDHLADLRRALMQAVQAVKREPDRAMKIRGDLLDPELAKISRRLRTIAWTHGLRIGGAAVGAMVASLVAFTSTGIAAGFGKLLSAAGLGSVCKEVSDLIKERASAKESPHYLLWRFRKLRK